VKMAAPDFFLHQSLGFRFEFHGHTFKLSHVGAWAQVVRVPTCLGKFRTVDANTWYTAEIGI
jgi:hypothetical protein